MQAELKVSRPDGAGRVKAAVGLHNKSGKPCTINGYPSLQLLAKGADPVSTSPVETGRKAKITVIPGGSAWAKLGWSAVAGPEDPTVGACGPAPAQLAVFAPDNTVQMDVAFSAGPVCNGGRIEVGAFRLQSPL